MAKKKKIEEQVTDNESEILTQEEERVQNFLVKNKNTIIYYTREQNTNSRKG